MSTPLMDVISDSQAAIAGLKAAVRASHEAGIAANKALDDSLDDPFSDCDGNWWRDEDEPVKVVVKTRHGGCGNCNDGWVETEDCGGVMKLEPCDCNHSPAAR